MERIMSMSIMSMSMSMKSSTNDSTSTDRNTSNNSKRRRVEEMNCVKHIRMMATSPATPTAVAPSSASLLATTVSCADILKNNSNGNGNGNGDNNCNKMPSILPRILSGSIGSIVTALVVTPLEVVKVRQQMLAPAARTAKPSTACRPCPSCGTIVFNNGLMECIVPRKSVPYMNKPKLQTISNSNNTGVFSMLRTIYLKEGFAGIYAGLAPTLVMSVPNTVLYFTSYDELVSWLRHQPSLNNDAAWIPLVAGSSARLLASLATAPLELIRTRQAILGAGNITHGVWNDLRQLVRHEGFPALFQGLAPTLWRDVPFSAIYWFSLEQFKLLWQQRTADNTTTTPLQQAGQAFCNGAAAGMIAAACTTPFDVVKTRHQALMKQAPVVSESTIAAAATVAVCQHNGAIAVSNTTITATADATKTIWGTIQGVVNEEGIRGLWRGNLTRIYKVAPACAIMISCYEFGKLVLLE